MGRAFFVKLKTLVRETDKQKPVFPDPVLGPSSQRTKQTGKKKKRPLGLGSKNLELEH